MPKFTLAKELQNDCYPIKELMFTSLLLYNDSRFLWFILVPKRPMLEEIYDMSVDEQQILFAEVSALGKIIRTKFKADKVNVASFGNVVKQLHIHIIGRYKTDDAWPKPVWCANTEKTSYTKDKVDEIKKMIEAAW